jgi:uncharacterized membrane protein YkoI
MKSTRNTLILASLAVLLVSVAALIAIAAETQEATEPGETVITVDQIPLAVMQAIQKLAPGGTIEKASTETEKGVTTYEATIKGAGGTAMDLKLAESGDVIEIEEIIAQAGLPPAVAKAVETVLPGGEITGIEKQTVIAYEIKKTIDGKPCELKIDASGKILKGKKENKEEDEEGEENEKDEKD